MNIAEVWQKRTINFQGNKNRNERSKKDSLSIASSSFDHNSSEYIKQGANAEV